MVIGNRSPLAPASSAPISGADDRADEGGYGVPGGVEVGDLVGDELHQGEDAHDDEDVGALESLRDARHAAQTADHAEQEHGGIRVEATRPSAGERQRHHVHAGIVAGPSDRGGRGEARLRPLTDCRRGAL